MPIIKREDGTIFTYANYRARILIDRPSLMKGEMKFLSQQHGAFTCIVPIDSQEAEGVFSKDAGYPLGEMIWDYFKRPQNLLYCESLTHDNANKAILVVVREGRVFLDAILEKEFIQDEFASLVAENIPMDIKVFGEIPLGETTDATHFAFPTELMKSFTHVDISAYEELRPLHALELVGPTDALKRAGVLTTSLLPIIVPVLIVIAIIGYFIYSNLATEEVQVAKETVQVDPFAEYTSTLTSPAPAQQFAFVNEMVQKSYTITNWKPTQFLFTSSELRIEVTPLTVVDLQGLALWAQVNKAGVSLAVDKSNVTFPADLPSRDKPTKIYRTLDILPGLVDHLTSDLIVAKVTTGEVVKKGAFQSTKLTVALADAAPSILTILGNLLNEKPVVLSKLDLKLDDKGNYSGNIEFEILGK